MQAVDPMTGRPMRRFWLLPLAAVAALFSAAMIIADHRSLIDLFELADPSGSFGFYFHLGGLAANLVTILAATAVLVGGPLGGWQLASAIVAFMPVVAEAVALLPCFLASHPGALCGVFAVMIAYFAIPVVIGAGIAFVATSRRRSVTAAGLLLAAVFAAGAAVAQLSLAPHGPADCRHLTEVTKRSNCLHVFANRTQDEGICRSIEFRTTRFTCLRDIAVAKGRPDLCGEIHDDDGATQSYGGPAVFYRDVCFQNTAFALHDRSQCTKVADPQLRAGCESGVR